MLENEPEGGERTGSQPADETAAPQNPADGGAVEQAGGVEGVADLPAVAGDGDAEPAPARRRATRRRATPVNKPEQTDAPVAAPATGAGSAESPQAEVLAPISGDLDSTPKTPRRRRKATAAKAVEEPLVAASAEEATAEVVPPVKVTRTRRKKTAPAAAEPAAETPAETADTSEEPAGETPPPAAETPAETADTSEEPAGETPPPAAAATETG
ncbi:ribonuclease E/G, partial [Micromonospora costi]